MKANLNLGKIANIKIQIHWTFLFLILWIIAEELRRNGSIESVFFNITFIVFLFLFVILHELGHALTAKHFDIATKKITLLPIGGIASLEKIPEDPKQELLVSIAGPLVNVVIATILFFFISFKNLTNKNLEELIEYLNNFTLQNFILYLFIVNVAMFVFNLIPAFPMDGGRIFRALLSMKMDRVKATQIAASVGQFIATVFLFIGLLYNPFLIFIALVIFIGAYGENKIVHHLSLLEGHKVREAMLTNFTKLKPENSMEDVINMLLSGSETDFIVINNKHILGILYHQDIIKNSKNRSLQIKDIMSKSFKVLDADSDLKDAYRLIASEKRPFFPVIKNDILVGAIDLNNLNEFIMIQTSLA